jgi:hypothetical protein
VIRDRLIALLAALALARCAKDAPLPTYDLPRDARAPSTDAAQPAPDGAVEDASDPDAVSLTAVPTAASRESVFLTAAIADRPIREPAAPTPVARRSGRAPTIAAALAALSERRSSTARFTAEGSFAALGGGRFVLVVSRYEAAHIRSPAFEVHVFSEDGGAAQIEGSAQIPTSFLFVGRSGQTGCAPSVLSREVRDIDHDRELELSLTLRYCLRAACTGGYAAMEYQAIYDLTPGPRLVLLVERRVRGQRLFHGTRTRSLTFRDVNRDGHPDAIATGRDCAIDPQRYSAIVRAQPAAAIDCATPELACPDNARNLRTCVPRSETALYAPAIDGWRLGTDGAEPLIETPCVGIVD